MKTNNTNERPIVPRDIIAFKYPTRQNSFVIKPAIKRKREKLAKFINPMKAVNRKNRSHASMKTDLTLENEEEIHNQSFHSSKSDLLRVSESINLVSDAILDQQNRSFQLFECDSDEMLSDRIMSPYHFDPINEPEIEEIYGDSFCPKAPKGTQSAHAVSNIEITLENSYSFDAKNNKSIDQEPKSAYFNDSLCKQLSPAFDPFFILELEPLSDLNSEDREKCTETLGKDPSTVVSTRADSTSL